MQHNLFSEVETAPPSLTCIKPPVVCSTVEISRAWAMPSRHTFLIKPIAKLIGKYISDGKGWVDPFAGENSPAEITNGMNPEKPAMYHLHAKEFAAQLTGMYEGVLFDPPYSLRQVKECYEKIGVKLFQEDTQRFPQNVKELIAPKIKAGGIAITFGWNSQGFGKNLGFELKEVYGLNIEPKEINSFDWIDCGEHRKIGWFGKKYNRTISWSDDDKQPIDERLVCLKFPTGAYIFGDGGLFDKDYPTTFFHKFWMELKSFNPDYIDSHNHCVYWKIENAKEIFNSFNDVLKKYYALNNEDIKQRRIEKMKSDLAKLEGVAN